MSKLGKEIKACELCGSPNSIELPYVKDYSDERVPFHLCRECGLVSYRFRRTPKELADYWEKEMFNKGNYVARNPYFKARHVYATEFLDVNLGLKGKKVVDIGAGDGQFLEYVRDCGADVFGIESSKTNDAILRKNGVDNFLGTVEDFVANTPKEEIKSLNADVVSILWTLQNSQSATEMLDAAYDILKDEGHIFIQLGLRILVPFHKPIDTYFTNVPGDLEPYRFSINTLAGFLAKSGFKITHTNNYWDQDVLNLVAQKRPRDETISWDKDNYEEVLNFITRWKNESELMTDYLKILNLDYKFYDKQLFWKKKGLK